MEMMKNHFIKRMGLLLLSVAFLGTFATVTNAQLSSKLTAPYGGRVLTTTIPTVTCILPDGGTAPVVLTSNLAGLVSAGTSATKKQDPLKKIANIGKGIYKAIPLYTTQGVTHTQPQFGKWILGNQYLIPDIYTCQTTVFGPPIPFPVVKTKTYGVSKQFGQ
jgi:hypothetical protein